MISTGRLFLRPFTEDDVTLINRLYSDPEIMKYMPFDTESMDDSREHLRRILEGWKADPVLNYEFAVLKKDTLEGIGRAHIQIDTETDTGMIGWLLIEDEWGRGYATEMTEAFIRYSFEALDLHRVNALCNPDNARSRKVLSKFMRQEAHYREKVRYTKGGKVSWEDEAEYALLRSEYRNLPFKK